MNHLLEEVKQKTGANSLKLDEVISSLDNKIENEKAQLAEAEKPIALAVNTFKAKLSQLLKELNEGIDIFKRTNPNLEVSTAYGPNEATSISAVKELDSISKEAGKILDHLKSKTTTLLDKIKSIQAIIPKLETALSHCEKSPIVFARAITILKEWKLSRKADLFEKHQETLASQHQTVTQLETWHRQLVLARVSLIGYLYPNGQGIPEQVDEQSTIRDAQTEVAKPIAEPKHYHYVLFYLSLGLLCRATIKSFQEQQQHKQNIEQSLSRIKDTDYYTYFKTGETSVLPKPRAATQYEQKEQALTALEFTLQPMKNARYQAEQQLKQAKQKIQSLKLKVQRKSALCEQLRNLPAPQLSPNHMPKVIEHLVL